MATSTPLQLIYGAVNLHEIGEVSIMSQSGQFSQEEIPQREARQLVVQIEVWNRGFDLNYNAIRTLREALAEQNQVLKWVTPGINGGSGTTQLERPAVVLSHDIPEDPNSWGVYQQQIRVTFSYEMNRKDPTVHLSAFVTGAGDPVDLGNVTGWAEDFKNNFFSEWHPDRMRSSGNVSCSGEILYELGETGGASDNRRTNLLVQLDALREAIQEEKQISLKYGYEGNYFFERTVKVESFTPTIDQLANKIRWTMNCSYTIFPDEAGFAVCEFTSALGRDSESGEETLTLAGRIVSATEAIAVAKLASVATAIQTAYGYTAATRSREDVTKNWINVEDTGNTNKFMELSFSYGYRKKMASVLSYTLTVTDSDDTASGLLRRTYSGSVVASGADADAALATALAQARSLGDKKHSYRMASEESRDERKITSTANREMVRLNFSYSYKLKGTRMFMEVRSSTQEDAFGESRESISGFVVAEDESTARTHYTSLVRNAYNTRIIRQESTEVSSDKIQLGAQWYGTSGNDSMFSRLDFSFTVFKAKAATTYGIKYGVRISTDFTQLNVSSTISGQFVGDPAYLDAIQAGTTNPLDTLLNSYVAQLGGMTMREVDIDIETTGTLTDKVAVRFSASYNKKATGAATVLKTELSESVTYSGTRWVFKQSPEGEDTPQDLGITQATRTVTGSITAATEAAAEAWVQTQRGASGLFQKWPTGTPGGTSALAKEMPIQVSRQFGFQDLLSGVARDTGANFRTVTMSFTFTQVIPNLAPPSYLA